MIKKIICGVLLLAMVCSLASCASDNNAGASGNSSGAKTDITVVLDWIPNTNHTGIYVAEKLGYFAEAGLKVKVEQPPEDGAEALVASGNAQFGISVQENMASSLISDSPLPVTAVAAILQHNTSGIVSLKDKGITSPKKMEGFTYAAWDMPVEQAILKKVMEKDGGDFTKLKQVPSTVTDTLAALQTNVDMVWIYYAWDGVAIKVKGLDTNYFEFRDIDQSLDYYTPYFIANNTFLADHPDTAKAFLKAVRKGYEYCIDHPEEAAAIICDAVPEIDRDIAVESQKYLAGQYKAEVSAWGQFDAGRWDGFYKWLYDNGVLDKEIPSGAGFSNDYLN